MLINKVLSEVVGDLVSERTSPRDLVQLEVTYTPGRKPVFVLHFTTLDRTKSDFPPTEDITQWVPEYSRPKAYGDGTPDPNYVSPFSDWSDAVRGTSGISDIVGAIVRANGVRYELVEK